jgi:hypothetical protein
VAVEDEHAGTAMPPTLRDTGAGGLAPSSLHLQRPWGAGVSSATLLPSSGTLASSHAVGGSHLLSSRARSSGSLFGHDTGDQPYPVDSTFAAPPTGLPKQAEGLPAGAPPPSAAPAAAPTAPNAKPRDALGFIGAPKPRSGKRAPHKK